MTGAVKLLTAGSGGINLQPASSIASDVTVNVPSVNGTLLSDAAPQSGGVIQVVNATNTTQVSTTSTSYSSTGLSASITPKFATSKILVLVSMRPGIVVSAQAVSFQLFRNGSNVFQIGTNTAYLNATGVAELHGCASSSYLDSPATTSSTTYTVHYATLNSGQAAFNNINNDTSSICLMEIAA